MRVKINFIIKIIGVLLAISIVTVIIALFSREEITKIATTEVIAKDTLSDIDVSQEQELEEYKKTEELTDEDISDEYQKNYQKTEGEDGSYLIKTAEWTNKEEGEALITIEGYIPKTEISNTALYITTPCYVHGLTRDIIIKNIQTLLTYYDSVDYIVVGRTIGDYLKTTFTYESREDEIEAFIINQEEIYGTTASHYSLNLIPTLQYYLFGNIGDDYISLRNMINNPAAIYASFDKIASGQGSDYATEKFFNFLTDYFGERYISCSCYSDDWILIENKEVYQPLLAIIRTC